MSSSRADLGVLAPVWAALAACDDVDLHLFLTGMHRAAGAPGVEGVPNRATIHEGGEDLGGATGGRAAEAMASINRSSGDLYAELRPDIVLVMGDRLDMLPAAVASLPFNLPLAHLHGGEVTEGAVDDRVRHALTKLSHLHCVSSETAKARLLAMGESDDRIFVTGAPGLDTLKAAVELSLEAFAEETGLCASIGDLSRLRLVTVHPETNAADPLAPLDAVLAALDARPAPTLFTAPNSDPGGAEAGRRINSFAGGRPWAHFVDTLGRRLFANTLRHAALMLGNSSSGVIEAGLFGLPVIDVGDRQKGRERGKNVMTVRSEVDAVIAALDELGPKPHRFAPGTPYGTGNSGPKVAEVLTSVPLDARLRRKDPVAPMGVA